MLKSIFRILKNMISREFLTGKAISPADSGAFLLKNSYLYWDDLIQTQYDLLHGEYIQEKRLNRYSYWRW